MPQPGKNNSKKRRKLKKTREKLARDLFTEK